MKDPYKILNLDRSASDEDVKKRYRKLAMEHHPDKGGDANKFKEIADAYDILSDPKKKSQWLSNERFSGTFDDSVYEDFLRNYGFADMFNSRYGWAQNGKGHDVKAQIQITLKEAYFGTKRELRLALKPVTISIQPGIVNGQRLRLKGLGQRGMTDDLNGDLIVTVIVLDDTDFMLNNRGLYKIHRINAFDAMLGGKSIIEVFDKKINFTIPKGTQNGSTLRIQGKGFPVYNNPGKYGDLYINILIDLPNDLNDEELNLISQVKQLIDNRIKNKE